MMSETLLMHQKSWAEAMSFDCYFGECDHDDECPTPKVETCRACNEVEPLVELEELEVLLPWNLCEERGHLPETPNAEEAPRG